MKKSKRKKYIKTVPLSASIDEVNQLLKVKFAVKHVNYVTNNGIIKFGWTISDEQGVDDAVKVLKVQAAPVYILGEFANAVIAWDAIRLNMTGGLWKTGKETDKFVTADFDIVKSKLIEWLKICNG